MHINISLFKCKEALVYSHILVAATRLAMLFPNWMCWVTVTHVVSPVHLPKVRRSSFTYSSQLLRTFSSWQGICISTLTLISSSRSSFGELQMLHMSTVLKWPSQHDRPSAFCSAAIGTWTLLAGPEEAWPTWSTCYPLTHGRGRCQLKLPAYVQSPLAGCWKVRVKGTSGSHIGCRVSTAPGSCRHKNCGPHHLLAKRGEKVLMAEEVLGLLPSWMLTTNTKRRMIYCDLIRAGLQCSTAIRQVQCFTKSQFLHSTLVSV